MFKKKLLFCLCVGLIFIQGCQNQPTVSENGTFQTVTISVDCSILLTNYSNVKPGYKEFIPNDGMIIPPIEIEIKADDTVLDVLKKATNEQGIALDVQGSYVQSIGNLPQFVCGDTSGWMYSVNGEYINQSASKKTVQSDDVVVWIFTCNNGRDISF